MVIFTSVNLGWFNIYLWYDKIGGEGWLFPTVYPVMLLAEWRRQGRGPLGYMVPISSTSCLSLSETKIQETLICLRTTWTSSWPWSQTSPPPLAWPGQQHPTVCWTRCLWFPTWSWTRHHLTVLTSDLHILCIYYMIFQLSLYQQPCRVVELNFKWISH